MEGARQQDQNYTRDEAYSKTAFAFTFASLRLSLLRLLRAYGRCGWYMSTHTVATEIKGEDGSSSLSNHAPTWA